MTDKHVTTEQLTTRGYVETELDFMQKSLGDEHQARLIVGNFPFNEPRVSIRVHGVTIGTNCANLDDLDKLESLLAGAPVDYDDVMYVDEDELQS